MQESAILAMQAINASDTSKIKNSAIPAVVIPNNSSVKSLEHLEINPFHFKSKFNTHLLADFVEYCKENTVDSTTTYIDTNQMRALTIFDHGSNAEPSWGYHQSTLTLKKTPAFADLLNYANNQYDQLDLIDFFNDWNFNVAFLSDENMEIPHQSAINLIRRLTVKNTSQTDSDAGNFSSSRSAMESIEVSAGDNKIPPYFLFTTQPHDGFDTATFKCSIRAMTDGKQVRLKFRIESFEEGIERIANEFKSKLVDKLLDSTIYIGTVEHR